MAPVSPQQQAPPRPNADAASVVPFGEERPVGRERPGADTPKAVGSAVGNNPLPLRPGQERAQELLRPRVPQSEAAVAVSDGQFTPGGETHGMHPARRRPLA